MVHIAMVHIGGGVWGGPVEFSLKPRMITYYDVFLNLNYT